MQRSSQVRNLRLQGSLQRPPSRTLWSTSGWSTRPLHDVFGSVKLDRKKLTRKTKQIPDRSASYTTVLRSPQRSIALCIGTLTWEFKNVDGS
ncbi:unnamed protein product [Zymoseptoria tritici ST99CH_3D7]|uniref:Uncharacterized protein n=1 Tax=Zymoseptoria tritici (strain ST99CH_3D7) TaxID=1276538 RepID=A0A1X7RNP5_ZYMT9|nr:unnamed protein product [Zymoseptoria tritici ST99CH_3D7]